MQRRSLVGAMLATLSSALAFSRTSQTVNDRPSPGGATAPSGTSYATTDDGVRLYVEVAFPRFPRHRVNVFEPFAASHKQPDSRSLTSSVDDVDCRSIQCN